MSKGKLNKIEEGNKRIEFLRCGELLSKAIEWEKEEFLKEYGLKLENNKAAERLVFLMIKYNIIPIEIFKEFKYISDNEELNRKVTYSNL